MKIYAHTNNNELDEFIGSGIWLLCDVQEYCSPYRWSDEDTYRLSSSSYAQENPTWVMLLGKLSNGKVYGDASMIANDELEWMLTQPGDYYFGHLVEKNWDEDSVAPISKLWLHDKDRILSDIEYINSSDISIIYPIEGLNTEEIFEEYPDDYYWNDDED